MVLVADVDPVDLDDAVALLHAGGLGRAARVHLADELPGPSLLSVQVEAVPVERGSLFWRRGDLKGFALIKRAPLHYHKLFYCNFYTCLQGRCPFF